MAIFLTGNDLNAQLENLFEYADEYIILISPYIKLHDRYASALKTKKDNPNLKIIVVFGKNEDDFSKSMKQEDFVFFKDFPNIEIRYEKRLHAKYYANESSAILTSMNLYNFSQDNNIEAGVLTNRKGILGSITSQDTLENDAAGYFERVIEQSDLLFHREPKFESTMLGLSNSFNAMVNTAAITGGGAGGTLNGNLNPNRNTNLALFEAARGTGMFGIKSLSYDEAMNAGKKWMGDNKFRLMSTGTGWLSGDKLRQFRFPLYKRSYNQIQSNFEWRFQPKGSWPNNGHSIINP